jgi:hypothetical protein
MNLSVSTRMEQAWYMDPELLADEEDAERPKKVEIDADAPPAKDATVVLGDGDLEELAEAIAAAPDDDARHYRDVSLRGAIMAADETLPTITLGERVRGLVDDGIAMLERAHAHLPPGAIPSRATQFKVRATAAARAAFDMLEPGRVAPPRLAAVAFLAGVGMTLVGVLIAL